MNILKRNNGAQIGDSIFLTKPLGLGILSTAQKQKKVTSSDFQQAVEQMCQLNDIGSKIAKISGCKCDYRCYWLWFSWTPFRSLSG